MMGKRVLLVEDNEKIMSGNIRKFKREGYDTDAALTLAEARASISERKPDAIVLDIMLPDGNGLDFMREIRGSDNSGIPVLFLTGLTTKEDMLKGIKSGGDDYLTKPYDFDILLARIEMLLRRAERVPEVITKGRLSLDVTAGVAMLAGADLLLAKKEFALLLIFVQNEGRYLSMEYLYEKVWKAGYINDNNALKNAVARLRPKIEGCDYRLEWSRHEGYCFAKE